MDYLDRLKNEYVDLCDKIDKLEMTIDDQDTAMLEGAETFPFVQVHLMRVQCDVMIGYRDILRARMSAAGVEIDNLDELIEQRRLDLDMVDRAVEQMTKRSDEPTVPYSAPEPFAPGLKRITDVLWDGENIIFKYDV